MRSIERRLMLSLVLVGCLLWGGGAIALYLAMRAGSIAEFDQSLVSSAQTLAALASQDNGVLEFDFDPALMPSFAGGPRPDYFQLWLPDGATWQRSPSLGEASLPPSVAGGEAPSFSNLTLPSGSAGRAVGTRFLATQTYDEVDAPPATPHPRVAVTLVVARDRADLDRRLSFLALTLLLVGAGTALATALLVPLLVRRGLRPLSNLAAQTAAIDATALALRLPSAGMPVELLPICDRLNELLARLQASFERERRFSADVAHELRTPIAELRSLAEVALKWPDDRVANARALQDALDVALRLQSITSGLLALARCEAGLQPVARERVGVAEILEASWRPLAEQAREKRLSASFDVADDVGCEADPSRLRLVLTNLLSNAVEYCPREGSLECRAQVRDGVCRITISNSTTDLGALDLPHLFERFWRKDPARTQATRSGLGLALVKGYAESMGMQVVAELRTPSQLSITLSARSLERQASKNPAVAALALALCCVLAPAPAAAEEAHALVVLAGRPLRVALDQRIRVKRVGQPVTATLVEPVYAYDRVVVAAGAKVRGRIAGLEPVSGGARFRGLLLRGDLSPARQVVLQFDRLVTGDGREIAIATRVGPGTSDVVLQAAEEPGKPGLAARARDETRQRAKQVVSGVKRPGKLRRLKQALLASLPFHAQYVPEATVYDAELLEALDFGSASVTERAPEGTPLPADGILNARLVSGLDSATTPRGTRVEAVLTQPLFSSLNQLILPEGTQLAGEVTFAKPASHFRRNGRLRLLFEAVRDELREPERLRASLHSAEVGRSARLAIDEEGGASLANPKTRLLAPALSAAVVGLSLTKENVYDPGEPGFATGAVEANSTGTALAGFSGLGVLGFGLSQVARPAGVALGFVGLARSLYGSLIGKGKEVSFPAGTRIQVKLAPGPSPAN